MLNNNEDLPRSVRMDNKTWEKLEKIGKKQIPKLNRAKMIIKLIWEWGRK